MIQQLGKDYMGGDDSSNTKPPEVKPQPKVTPVVSKPAKTGGKVPPVPKIPAVPKMPVVNKQPEQPKKEEINIEQTVQPEVTTNSGLMEEIRKGGFSLKKVETVEKAGLEYMKKNSVTKAKAVEQQKIESQTEVKNDLFSELKRVQLKKVK